MQCCASKIQRVKGIREHKAELLWAKRSAGTWAEKFHKREGVGRKELGEAIQRCEDWAVTARTALCCGHSRMICLVIILRSGIREPRPDIIQVNGLCVVGTPVGPKDYVREYVRNKCGTICKDIDQMRVCADPLIRYQLLKFCMNTRLSFLSRNVIPDNMATDCDDRAHIGPAHVDNKIVQEVLRAATGDTLMHAPQLVQKWCKLKVQSPHHEGGYA